MKQKGLLTELHCQLAFTELGFLILSPSSEDSRYDFVVDIGNKFLRIQCKTCSLNDDKTAITFACRSTRSTTQENISRRYTKDEIDYFYTYYNNKSYLIPVEECSTAKTLRFISSSSNQKDKISFASDYEIKTILQNKEGIFSFQEILMKESFQKKEQKNSICPNCGQHKTPMASLCRMCSIENSRLTERPSREELKEKIRTTPFTQIASQYNVTDNAIRKWCKAENLPHRVSDIKNISDSDWEQI